MKPLATNPAGESCERRKALPQSAAAGRAGRFTGSGPARAQVSAMVALSALLCAAAASAAQERTARAPSARLTDLRTGTVATREGLRLKLVTDIGNVRIQTSGTSAAQVSYSVRIETDSRQPEARGLLQQFKVTHEATPEGVSIRGSGPWKKEFRGRLWVAFEVAIPRRYSVEVETGAGNIDAQTINGYAALTTMGGNVVADGVNGPAKLKSAGGHIKVGDVGADLSAITGGGHVEAGRVAGGAYLSSEGGHVKALSVEKWAELRTAGGNIYLKHTGGKAVVESGGGQINLGEVAGSVQASTGGGGIHIARVAGPTNIQTAGGSIYLEQVHNTVHANTGSGQITARFVTAGQKDGNASQLVCGQGDILVYLPREIALNIEAVIEAAGEHRIILDPRLKLKTTYVRSDSGPRVLRANGELNGGGKLLKLRTMAGNIQVAFIDEGVRVAPAPAPKPQPAVGTWWDRWGMRVRGCLQVNSEKQAEKLAHVVKPGYPERAKREGIEGWVWVYVSIDESGQVEGWNVISGHPWLAEAAVDAVRQWRYEPTVLDGQPVKVCTVVKVVFSLRK
ncbi:MAG: TonB family protein [Candidatus Acidiferrales bacterium]